MTNRSSLGIDKALTRFAQGTAANEYNNYANRLMALAGIGQSATASTARTTSGVGRLAVCCVSRPAKTWAWNPRWRRA